MILDKDIKDKDKMLEKAEIEELEAYCKSQKFTKEETERFVKNSMARFKKYSIPSDI